MKYNKAKHNNTRNACASSVGNKVLLASKNEFGNFF